MVNRSVDGRVVSFLDCKELSRIINLIIGSSSIRSIILPHAVIRSNIHAVIYGDIGVGKSSILYTIIDSLNLNLAMVSLTSATLLGSVDKSTGIFIPPAVWDCKNSIMCIDEFYIPNSHEGNSDTIRTLLQVMETSKYEKRIGYRCNPFDERYPEDKNIKDLYCIVDDHKIRVKTRFSLIATTMMNLNKGKGGQGQSLNVSAFKSRCIVIPFNPSFDDLFEMADGKKMYKFEDLRHKEIKDVIIDKRSYNIIKNYAKKSDLNKSDVLRTIGDLCRVYAVTGKIIKSDFDIIIKLKKLEE